MRLVIILLALSIGVTDVSFAENVSLRLRPIVVTQGNGVELKAIVVNRDELKVLGLQGVTIELVESATVLRKRDIEKAINARLLTNDLGVKLIGPENITVRKKGIQLSAAKINRHATMYILQEIAEQYSIFSVEAVAKAKPVSLPTANYVLSPRWEKKQHISNRELVWLDIFIKDELYRSVPVWFELSIEDDVWVFAEDAQKNRKLNSVDLQRIRTDITRLSAQPVVELIGQEDKILNMNYRRGDVLTLDMLRNRPAVLSGDAVTVRSFVGAVMVEAEALALSEGEIGDAVSLRIGNDSIVTAEVKDSGILEVSGGQGLGL